MCSSRVTADRSGSALSDVKKVLLGFMSRRVSQLSFTAVYIYIHSIQYLSGLTDSPLVDLIRADFVNTQTLVSEYIVGTLQNPKEVRAPTKGRSRME